MVSHIQIKGVIPRIQYIADGAETTFEFPFAVFNANNLSVYLEDALQDPMTYVVSGAQNTDGGTVTFNTPPEEGLCVTLCRSLSIERLSDFQEGAALRANVLNDELDYQTACLQEVAENLNRSMVLPPYAVNTDVNLTLPTPSAGKAIVWNSDGTNLENSTVAVNALESTLNGYKIAAKSAATTATEKASIATNQAQTATTQAGIATQKASEASTVVNRLTKMQTNTPIVIPQDIKLELSSGTLTIKAGTKFYAADGTQYSIASDVVAGVGGANAPYFIFPQTSGGVTYAQVSICYSGSTAPTVSGSALWLDTPNNVIKYTSDSGATWNNTTYGLPIAICTPSSGSWVSIDKVFNGFGYIASTVFVLPGVKGLIPDGRNADGTLKNIEYTQNSVAFYTGSSGLNGEYNIVSETGGSVYPLDCSYDSNDNIIKRTNGALAANRYIFGTATFQSGTITSFNIKTTFHAVDYNDIPYIWSKNAGSASIENPVVVVKTYKNGTDWYRIWSDGWIEQGGSCGGYGDTGGEQTITFLKPFSDANYLAVKNYGASGIGDLPDKEGSLYERTTTTMKTHLSSADFSNGEFGVWYACGY